MKKSSFAERCIGRSLKVLGFCCFFPPSRITSMQSAFFFFFKQEIQEFALKRKNSISDFQKALKIRRTIKPHHYCSCRMQQWSHLEMLLTNKCICLGNTDLGSLFSKEQESKWTILHGDSPAWKQFQSCLEMKNRACQPGKYLSLRILQ